MRRYVQRTEDRGRRAEDRAQRAAYLSSTLYLLFSILILVLLSACEEDVVPVLGTERAFSLYGVITPEANPQFVRVFPIEGRLEQASPEPLDAVFTSTDLQTGAVRVWQDSLIQGSGGDYEHVFWSPFTAQYGHTYRLEVTRPDGVTTRVDAEVPPRAQLVPQPVNTSSRPVALPILVDGDVPHLLNPTVTYFFKYDEGTVDATTMEVVLPYEGTFTETAEGWVMRINLSQVYSELRDRLRTAGLWNSSYGIVLLEMELHAIAANAAWDPPGGTFDPQVLVQPGTMSNVENGFGFVGAGYRLQHFWLPEPAVREAAGFRLPTDI